MNINSLAERAQPGAQHYLRTPDGTVYGPVDIATLCTWATDARVIPGCALSGDRHQWVPVESYPELRLNWSVQFDDGTSYGPLNLLGIWVLAGESSIPKGVALVEKDSGRTCTLDDSLHPMLVEECRRVLSGCGRLMGEMITALAGARKEALGEVSGRDADLCELRESLQTVRATLADRETQLGTLRFKLSQTESDLAVNLKLVAETQRHLSESDKSEARIESHAHEIESLRASLVTARMTLTERDSQLEAVRLKLGEMGNELAVNQKLVAETQRRLAEYAALAALAGAGNQENEVLCRSLASTRVDLADRESQCEVLRARGAQLEQDLRTERSGTSDLQAQLRRLEEVRGQESGRADKAEQDLIDMRAELAAQAQCLSDVSQASIQLEARLTEALTEVNRYEVESRERIELERVLAEARQFIVALQEQAIKDADSLVRSRSGEDAMARQLQEVRALIMDRDQQVLRLESAIAVAKAEAGTQASQLQARLDLSQQALLTEQERTRQETEALAHLRAELDSVMHRMQELQTDLQNKTNVVRKLETAIAVQQAETDKRVSGLRSKNTVLEKDLQLAHQAAHSLTLQMNQLKDSSSKAQKAGRAVEQKLKDELAAIQSDLNGLMMASRCVKQISDTSNRAPIDWLGGAEAVAVPDSKEEALEARFAKLPLAEKLVVLQKELQASAEQKELMRRELTAVKSRYDLLSKESSSQAKESEEKLAQIQKEVKTSSELLSRTMHELEKRESQIRDMRKRSGSGGASDTASPEVMDAEVIHSEVLGRDETAHGEAAPAAEGASAAQADPPKPVPAEKVLNSVEAQLQRELKHWETMKRDKDNNEGTRSKWFRWKSS